MSTPCGTKIRSHHGIDNLIGAGIQDKKLFYSTTRCLHPYITPWSRGLHGIITYLHFVQQRQAGLLRSLGICVVRGIIEPLLQLLLLILAFPKPRG